MQNNELKLCRKRTINWSRNLCEKSGVYYLNENITCCTQNIFLYQAAFWMF